MRDTIFVGRDQDSGNDVELPPTGLVVIGPSGCGKTTGIALRAIRDWPGPVIAVSSSTNLYDLTSGAESGVGRSQLGPVSIFDPLGRLSSGRRETWEILRGCLDPNVARDRAWDMFFGAEIGRSAPRAGDVTHEHHLAVNMVLTAAAASGEGPRILGSWLSSGDWGNAAAWLRHSFKGQPDDEAGALAMLTRPHVKETLRDVFGLFTIPAVVDATTSGSFDASAFVSQASTLYVVTDRTVAPLAGAFLGELPRTFLYWVQQGFRPNPPLLLVIDDMSNAVSFPGIRDVLSKGPAWGLVPVFLIQDTKARPALLDDPVVASAGGESRVVMFTEEFVHRGLQPADPATKGEAVLRLLRDNTADAPIVLLTIPNALADGWDPAPQHG